MKKECRVHTAQPYQYGEMGSFGKASYMLIRQFQFPDTFAEDEKHHFWDHDRCYGEDYKNAQRCFSEHTGRGDLAIERWIQNANNKQIFNFLIDILKADKNVVWTGYRVLGTVNRGNGCPVWTLELFAKNPKSQTKVYTGPDAPNVRSVGPISSNRMSMLGVS